ncbi:GNAT family N-acetyltransferase [Micromonospora sp. 4G55]|uniref:GNAT family N-acetyltransferase n=1 Tax=Micromonospora sp. 4G55 TaxID=2806102 RepID=UPI002811F98E|nr:GNAT family N-acetyltransferase [Micromonospora sp. 4G55]
MHWALARLDGVPAGWLRLELPQLDNTDNAVAELVVHPAYRRRSVGRALHQHGVRLLRDAGRKRVMGEVVSALPGGPARDPPGRPSPQRSAPAPRWRRYAAGWTPPRSTGPRWTPCWPAPGARPPVTARPLAADHPRGVRRRRRLPGGPADDRRAPGRPGVGAGAGRRGPDPEHRAGARPPGQPPLPRRGGRRALRSVGRLEHAQPRRQRGLARVAADHHRGPGPPRSPARPAHQDRESGARPGVRAGAARDRHLQRGGERAHDPDQRAARLPAGRRLDGVAAGALTAGEPAGGWTERRVTIPLVTLLY